MDPTPNKPSTPFRNEASLAFYSAFLTANPIEIWTSPHYDRALRVRLKTAALCVPLDADARRRFSTRFGGDKIKKGVHVMLHHTSYSARGRRKLETHGVITAIVTEAEDPDVTAVVRDNSYVDKIYRGQVYIFAFRPWPEHDSDRDWFFSHLPCA